VFFQYVQNSGAAPTATLLDGFEANPYTALNGGTWDHDRVSVDRRTTHETQGTYAWRIQASGGTFSGDGYISGPNVLYDLQDYSNLYIDVYISSLPSDCLLAFGVFDQVGFTGTDTATTSGATGAFTLSLDLTTVTPRSNIAVSLDIIQLGLNGGNAVVYVDNLRAV